MKTDITILCDNYVGRPGLIGEHGFSALIERGSKSFLFDSGSGAGLEHNAKLLQKSIKGLSGIFISHGHYDHTGGLKWAIEENGRLKVFAHENVFLQHMIQNPRMFGDVLKFIGCPATKKELENIGAEFILLDQTEEVEDGIWMIAGIERKEDQTPVDRQFLTKDGENLVTDIIPDDTSLLIETSTDPVLLLGCAHAGVLNILDHIREKMKITKLRAILGGTHLVFFSHDVIEKTIKSLENFDVKQIGVSHCTGMNAAIALGSHFKDRFTVAAAGSQFSFD